MIRSPQPVVAAGLTARTLTQARVLIFIPTLLAALPVDAASAGEQRWFRGNLHTHSLWSDGDDYPEMIALWYRDRGYQFLCFTDHNTLQSRERWIDVEKSKGGRKAYDRLKQRFPEDWVNERIVAKPVVRKQVVDGKTVEETVMEERLEVRLKKFDETSARIAQAGEFLLLHGEEISDRFGNLPLHLNASNIQELIPPLGGGSVREVLQNNVSAVVAQRERTRQPIMVHVNHPNFGYAVTSRDLMHLIGEKFFEVYNGHPGVNNTGNDKHIGTERMWDIILTMRLAVLDLPVMYGIAVDDGHNYHRIPSRASEPGRGWVMVRTDELTPGSLINALESGHFYASSGVTLQGVTATNKGLTVNIQPAEDVTYRIDFIGTTRDAVPTADDEQRQDVDYPATIGRTLSSTEGHSATYTFRGDEVYVRARITSSRKHPNPSEPGEFERAWAQPVVGPAARGQEPTAK